MTLLVTLLIFIIWSGFVLLMANFFYRKEWSFSYGPEFWLISFCACFLPLLPLPEFNHLVLMPEFILLDGGFTRFVQTAQTEVIQITKLELNMVENWLFVGLILFSLKGLSLFTIGTVKTRRIILASEQIQCADIFTERQIEMVKKYKIKVRLTNRNISPFSFGFLNAYLILPQFILQLPKQQLKLLIDHEINHIVRNDHRWLILVKLTTRLFSFNPIFKRFENQFINAIELRCDRDVLRQVSDIKVRKNYAEAILKCLRQCVGEKEQQLVTHFSNPETGVSFYQARLKAIMGYGMEFTNYKQLILTSILMILAGLSVNVVSANYVEDFADNITAWQLPLEKVNVSSPYGAINPVRNNVPHGGIDLKADIGTPVHAVSTGRVTVADSTSLHRNYGKVVVIKHANGYQSLYAHLNDFEVHENDKVVAGQIIGLTGNTGKTTGPHLHFELIKGKSRVDPKSRLTF